VVKLTETEKAGRWAIVWLALAGAAGLFTAIAIAWSLIKEATW